MQQINRYRNNQWTTKNMSVAERFWVKVDRSDPCWLFMAGRNWQGYGLFWLHGRLQPAHRVAYMLTWGAIPEGHEVDHLCRNPPCVNPSHLEAVTPRENQWRGVGTFADVHGKKTHCKRGHPFDEANTYWFPTRSGGQGRQCRTCQKANARAAQARKRATK